MPLVASALAAAIQAQIVSDLAVTDPKLLANYEQLSTAIATAIVTYFVTNASIYVTTAGLATTTAAGFGAPVLGAIGPTTAPATGGML